MKTKGAQPARSITPAPHLRSLTAYGVPQAQPHIDLALGATERPLISSELRAVNHTIDATSLGRYPDTRALTAELAMRLKVDATQVLVTAGADEAIDRLCRAMLCPGRALLVAVPTFEMIPHFARLAGAEVQTVVWEPKAAYPLQGMLEAATDATAVVAVVSPNNPTGAVITSDELQKLSHGMPNAVILVDLAYGEFAEHDLTETCVALPNVVMTRTFSKAWGLPGLRLGYAVGAAEVLGWMRLAGSPYSVARPSLALAHARLRVGEPEMRVYVERVRNERRQLEGLLKHLNTDVIPSHANFVLALFKNAEWATQALASLGVSVRAFSEASLRQARRISCPGDSEAFARLSAALSAALTPQALLFDMDGVLADVSHSYREAIIATAARYGINLTHADVTAAKSAGGANNDWALTQRLLAERGVHHSLEEVTATFEQFYQGDGEIPGLRCHETLLPKPALLKKLAQRLPLAVVTGRPRADAMRFLKEKDIGHCFQAVVCMEDGPLKPDPAPVHQALQRLGVQTAWMVGDTPDDVRAARACSTGSLAVVPVGIVAPGDTSERMAAVLSRSGAARVLVDLEELALMLEGEESAP